MRWLAFITLMLPLVSFSAEPLGRLFFTPQQRATLDNSRGQKIKIEVETVETEPPAMEIISFNGVIKRSDGQSTVWINHHPLNEKRAPSGIKIISRSVDDASVTLQLPQSSSNVDLKVGQNLDTASGQIQESYQRSSQLPVNEKKTVPPSAQSAQQNALASPAPKSKKPKSKISAKEAGDEFESEPPPQTDEQPANSSTQ